MMKKILSKLRKKPEPSDGRITNDTVAEHREQILAGGRKFKYPLQYVKHKLVYNAILISLGALILASIVGWAFLYPGQNTSDFMYRITRVIPVPVAYIDGQPVLYSDYLMYFRSSLHFSEAYQQLDPNSADGKRQIDYIKQESMKKTVGFAYGAKLADKLNLKVTDEEISSLIKSQMDSQNVSEKTFNASIIDYYNWTPDEYRRSLKQALLKQKVAYEIDKTATSAATEAEALLKQNSAASFKEIADSLSNKYNIKITNGSSGWVQNNNADGGIAQTASKLNRNELALTLKSSKGDGYYEIRLLDKTGSKVSYEYINIPLNEFNNLLAKLIKDGKLNKFISLKDTK